MIKGLFIFLCLLSAEMYVPSSLMAFAGNNMSLSADPTSIQADGLSTTTIKAVVDNNGILLTGVTLTFTTTQGFFQDPTTGLLDKKTIVTYSDTVGESTVVLYSDTVPGTATITCVASGIGTYIITNPAPPPPTITISVPFDVTRTVDVYFTGPGPTNSIVLSAAPSAVPADDLTPSTITAKLYDKFGTQIVKPGIPVNFTVSGVGHFSNNPVPTPITVSTDATGTATALVYSAVAGTSAINASTNGISSTIYVIFTEVAPRPILTTIVLSAAPPSVPADNLTSSTITAKLYDQNNKQITTPGISVNFVISSGVGHFSNNQTSIPVSTDGTGTATALLYSSVTGSVGVSASANGISSASIFVIFTAPPTPSPTPTPTPTPFLTSIVLTVNPTAVPADNLTPSTISAQLFDQFGKSLSLPGVSVTFTTAPAGLAHFSNNLTTIAVSTNGSGLAAALLYSQVVGTATVNATSGSITTNPVFVNFTGSGPTADILLKANPASNPADNLSASTITATLFDVFGNTVNSGVKVTFKTTLGKFTNNDVSFDAFTNSVGVATAFVSSGSVGTAQISASSNGITRYVNVTFTGEGPPAFISLSASSNWIPADGYTFTAITATILDSAGQPVAAGTAVTFTTTLGVFENGKTTLVAATTDATGTLTVHLRSTSTIATGTAVITCTSGTISQSITVGIVKLEFETEPNNDMAHADAICFNNVFLAQLSSPYEEDWYTFTINTPSRIGINFITTAIPAIATQCKTGVSTVGTYRVDIRDGNNNILMSYQNVDCIFDNGIWETGVVPAGKYYVVVYCPRLPDNSHYLSSAYYLAVFDNFYLPCGYNDKLVNSASLSLETSAYHLNVPIIDTTPYLWADLMYDPVQAAGIMFRLTDYGILENLNDFRSCNVSNLYLADGNYILHIPVLILNGISYRVDFTYVPTTDGIIWFMLRGIWPN